VLAVSKVPAGRRKRLLTTHPIERVTWKPEGAMPNPFEAKINPAWPGFWRVLLVLGLGVGGSHVAPAQAPGTPKTGSYSTVVRFKAAAGAELEQLSIHGPSTPPPGFEAQRQAVSLARLGQVAGTKLLATPAFDWVFGCSAVSGAMIAGYYDWGGYPNMYTGPANGGVMPANNHGWPTWSDGTDTYPSCPLIASRQGLDGRASKGSIDDYWVQYSSTASDPYLTGGYAQHAWGTAIGDYMKTSQSAYSNADSSTCFYNYTSSPLPLTSDVMEANLIADRDGTYGRKLFYEARGYTVTACYNQKTDNTIAGGFSFVQFKAEIDAGRPVMLNLAGHTVVGVGYDDAGNTVYLHDTWDYATHTMTWGGSYTGLQLLSVSIVNLAPVPSPVLGNFTPTSAPVGTTVTLSGSAFTGATAVSFNGVPAPSFTVGGDTQIFVTVPVGAGTGRITVDAPGGSAQSSFDFTVITYDLNGDGRIDLKDLARIARCFGTSRAMDPAGFQAQCDLNGDGVIDEQDVTILFGKLD